MCRMCDCSRMPPSEVTGLDLKLARVGARVRQQPLAEAMGVSASRVAAIEREAVVTEATVERYRRALDMCRTTRTEVAAAQ